MYLNFYEFSEQPFNLTPNSKFFFSSRQHNEALSAMVYTVSERKGFVVISGDIGSGKTTVCRTLLNKLGPDTKTALITNTHMSSKDLHVNILEDFEIEYKMGSKAKLLDQLNAFLIEQLRMDNNVVLIIDEAQNLTISLLEEVRMLSNLETENEKLIQIILMGQPELKKKLASTRLAQLRQRIALYYELKPLTLEEAKEYVQYRLNVVMDNPRQIFTPQALNLVYDFSKGTPRLINQICDSALLTGFIKDQPVVDEVVMQEVIQESPMSIIGGDTLSIDQVA